MNAILLFPPNLEASYQYTDGVVCASCLAKINSFSLFGPKPDDAGLNRRMYLGYCLKCDKAFEVEQFEQAGVWRIHRYRFENGNWMEVQPMPLPIPPIVQTGQGDLTQTVSDAQLEAMLQKATLTLNSLGHVMGGLIELIRAKKQA